MKIKTKLNAGTVVGGSGGGRGCGGVPVIGFGFLTGARAARSSEGAIKPKLENAMKIKSKVRGGSGRSCATPYVGFGFQRTGSRGRGLHVIGFRFWRALVRTRLNDPSPSSGDAMKIKTKIKSGSRNCDIFIGLPADWRSVPRVC